jgi:hypothetical protein
MGTAIFSGDLTCTLGEFSQTTLNQRAGAELGRLTFNHS